MSRRVTLTAPHRHAGIDYAVGAQIPLSARDAARLVEAGRARYVPLSKSKRRKTAGLPNTPEHNGPGDTE